MSIRSLAYVIVETTKLAAWRGFAADVLGMQEVESESDDALHFRIDDRPFRFRVEKGSRDGVIACGLEYSTREAFEAGLAKLEQAGVELDRADDAGAAARHVRGLARCADPAGNKLELVWGGETLGTPFVSPAGVSGFVTDEGGMGHVVLPTTCFDDTCNFYRDLLGFEPSDEMRIHMPGVPPAGLGLMFMHAQGPRHHVVAVGEFPSPTGLIHAMVEVKTIDEVGLALDRAMAAGHHISSTLGRHTNDKMISFYVRTPTGFDVEYGCDGWQCFDWDAFTPTFTKKEDLWGHRWDFGPAPQ